MQEQLEVSKWLNQKKKKKEFMEKVCKFDRSFKCLLPVFHRLYIC